jgi:isopenicillin N synthase-like dioxygenase
VSVIATIDVGDLEARRAEVAAHIRDAMAVSGFFQIAGHGIGDTIIGPLRAAARAFFAAPEPVKQAIAINKANRGYLAQGMARMQGADHTDLKEVFFWGRELGPGDREVRDGLPLSGVNQWPAEPTGFRTAVMNYHGAIASVGNNLLAAIAESLGASPQFFEPHYGRSMTRGQLIRYPAPRRDAPATQFGVAPHTDFGCITLLLQETPGLEVQVDSGAWVEVPPQPGTLVVNIGDLLERWSNGRYPSTRHRVRNATGEDRYSIAMFHDPDPSAIIDPAHLTPQCSPRFVPIAAADHILERNKAAFAHYAE